jgi:hypothetical protein
MRNWTILGWLTLIWLVPGCPSSIDDDSATDDDDVTGGDDDDTTEGDDDDTTAWVEATVHPIDAVSGAAPAGAEVTFDDGAVAVSGGVATGDVVSGAVFDLVARADGYADYHLLGSAGDQAFDLFTYMSSRSTTDYVLGMLSTTLDPAKAIVVVGVDTPALAPVVGARVSIDATHDESFVFDAQSMPAAGDTILDGGASFVSFPNVTAGPVSITIEPPDGMTCQVFPGPGELPAIEAFADAVSVISATCE